MIRLILLAIMIIPFGLPAQAQEAAQETAQETVEAEEAVFSPVEAGEQQLDEFLWTHRPLVIFADSPNDPRFVEQMEFLAARFEDLITRDVVVITDTDPAANSPIREQLRPRGFMLVLLSKDGDIHLRKPTPWQVRELTRSVDKMPIRQQELRDMRMGR